MKPLLKKIALATDFSAASQAATEYAKVLARSLNLPLTIVHVFNPEGIKLAAPYFLGDSYAGWWNNRLQEIREKPSKYLDDLAGNCLKEGITPDPHLLEGEAGEKLVNFTKEFNVDLLIMGTHGYTGIKKWMLGSIADYVLRHSDCTVMLIKQQK